MLLPEKRDSMRFNLDYAIPLSSSCVMSMRGFRLDLAKRLTLLFPCK